jgi:hypothetical protein
MLVFFVGVRWHPAIDRGWLLSFRADLDMSRPREIGSGFTPWKCGDSSWDFEIRTSWNVVKRRETSWNVVKRREILELFDSHLDSERTDTTCLAHVHDMSGAFDAGARHFDCLALSRETCKRPDWKLLLVRWFLDYLNLFNVICIILYYVFRFIGCFGSVWMFLVSSCRRLQRTTENVGVSQVGWQVPGSFRPAHLEPCAQSWDSVKKFCQLLLVPSKVPGVFRTDNVWATCRYV